MARCRLCLLPDRAPGADISKDGVCAFCRSHSGAEGPTDEGRRLGYERDLEETLAAARGGSGAYDALVCLSGGKDSLYLLYQVKKTYGLKPLAFTTDVNIPELAWRNIRRAVNLLQVDHLVYRPPSEFYRRLFRYLLSNQEARGAVYTVSYVYAPLFEGDALTVATEKGIPLVLAGYSPGQPEASRMTYEFDRELVCSVDWTPPALRDANLFSTEELERFWNPGRYAPSKSFPRYIAPFHAWKYDQAEIMRKVVELGLVAKPRDASPVHSNYPINWLLMYSDIRSFGYNPYAPEFSSLIREGKASRAYWRAFGPFVDFMIKRKVLLGTNVTTHLKWLGLTENELRITKPKGAYDPPLIAERTAGVSLPPSC